MSSLGERKERWHEKEIEILKLLYPTGDKEKVLNSLPGRTWSSVVHKSNRLRIFKVQHSRKKIEFICESCNKKVKRYYNKHNSDRFCSHTCYYTWRSLHPEENYFHKFPRVGELNGNWGRCKNHRKAVNMRRLSLLGRLAQGPQKITEPEQALYDILERLGVEFEPQKYIGSYCVDAFIKTNIILEVDGEYWHNYPHGKPQDKKRDTELTASGYDVHRYWAQEIMSGGRKVVQWLLGE